MKHRNFHLVLVVSLCFLLTGCLATHMGTMSGSASLSSPNFMYKKQNIFGESTATYILGIGGEGRQSLIIEAKKNMLKENPMLQNQALANVTVSYKTTHFIGFLVMNVKCMVSADVVEFGPVQTDFSQSQAQSGEGGVSKDSFSGIENRKVEKITNQTPKVGDEVYIINYFNEPVKGKIMAVQNGNYTVEYTNRNNKVKKAKVLGFQVQKIGK